MSGTFLDRDELAELTGIRGGKPGQTSEDGFEFDHAGFSPNEKPPVPSRPGWCFTGTGGVIAHQPRARQPLLPAGQLLPGTD